MKITGANWHPDVNRLEINCDCGGTFFHRADRWKVHCPDCGCREHLSDLRGLYANEAKKT